MSSGNSAGVLSLLAFLLFAYFGVVYARRVGESNNRRESYDRVIAAYAPQLRSTSQEVAAAQKSSLFDSIGDKLINQRYKRALRRRLVSTGRQDMSSYRVLVRRKVMGLIIGFIYGVLIKFDGSLMGYVWLVGFTVVGFVLPDILAYNTGTKRKLELDKALPDAIDILNLCVESGLTFQAAMGQVAAILKGPISQEFSRVLRQMQLGQPMIQSLQDMAARNGNPEMERFVTVIVQSEKLGIPIAAVLAEQSREMRIKRRDRARELAQKVPVKILMPVMLCFLPGIFIVILGPAILSIMTAF